MFVKTLTADEKHYLLNRDNLTQPIQVQLSQKIKTFSHLFFTFLKAFLTFKHLATEDIRKYGLRKTWLDKCLKSRVSENP